MCRSNRVLWAVIALPRLAYRWRCVLRVVHFGVDSIPQPRQGWPDEPWLPRTMEIHDAEEGGDLEPISGLEFVELGQPVVPENSLGDHRHLHEPG